jgi:hypothetical protein
MRPMGEGRGRRLLVGAAAAIALASCSDLIPDCQCGSRWTPSRLTCSSRGKCEGGFELVGANDLHQRGMNSAIAIAGNHAYVGSRTDGHGIWHDHAEVLILDIADPANPTLVGAIGPPDEGVIGVSSRELRAVPDKNLLIVMNLSCAGGGMLFACGQDWNRYPTTGGIAETANLKLYDITNRANPVHIGTYDFGYHPDLVDRPNDPHEMFLWRDPLRPDRLLLYVTALPGSPNIHVLDISDPTAPRLVLGWDTFERAQIDASNPADKLHSLSVSQDGRTIYLAHFGLGFFMLDSTSIAMDESPPRIELLTPIEARVDYSPPYNFPTHTAVPVPNRDLVLLTDEVFSVEVDAGCPWGWGWMVDVADKTRPKLFNYTDADLELHVAGQLRLPENDPGRCPAEPIQRQTSFSAHNPTVTEDLALVSWYGGGLQAFDISNPAAPVHVGAFYPSGTPESVAVEDPSFSQSETIMWSYPIVKDGLIYVVDARNGLYVLRYTGPYADQIAALPFLEGNSNLR